MVRFTRGLSVTAFDRQLSRRFRLLELALHWVGPSDSRKKRQAVPSSESDVTGFAEQVLDAVAGGTP
jgi:hypothetical protein